MLRRCPTGCRPAHIITYHHTTLQDKQPRSAGLGIGSVFVPLLWFDFLSVLLSKIGILFCSGPFYFRSFFFPCPVFAFYVRLLSLTPSRYNRYGVLLRTLRRIPTFPACLYYSSKRFCQPAKRKFRLRKVFSSQLLSSPFAVCKMLFRYFFYFYFLV